VSRDEWTPLTSSGVHSLGDSTRLSGGVGDAALRLRVVPQEVADLDVLRDADDDDDQETDEEVGHDERRSRLRERHRGLVVVDDDERHDCRDQSDHDAQSKLGHTLLHGSASKRRGRNSGLLCGLGNKLIIGFYTQSSRGYFFRLSWFIVPCQRPSRY